MVIPVLLSLLIVCARAYSLVVPSSLNDTISIHNRTSGSSVSANNELQISCNAPLYGQNLKVPSCKRVFGLINKDDMQLTFAERGARVTYDLPLPYRLQSSQWAS